ncbi:UvrB/uvrC motif protein [Elysia marginata]|uniref:UvrB/uvrC motif protein n=1 Tax=Elysia marginata TaxID=1093978 RepID=A0AAV4FX26_9GAST|nr:UvrB/uvrC motif protein [Elysia marginata]
MNISLVQLEVKGISNTHAQRGAYALILSEVDGDRNLPIIIGGTEAQSIVVAMEQHLKPPRPLTHDLFKNFIDRFDILLKQVIINKLVDGVFYSSIICKRDSIEEIIDSRTSDAIALALRFGAPIFVYSNVLEKAGIEIKEYTSGEIAFNENKEENKYGNLSLEQLEKYLKKAVKEEKYEIATKLRDEIASRKKRQE